VAQNTSSRRRGTRTAAQAGTLPTRGEPVATAETVAAAPGVPVRLRELRDWLLVVLALAAGGADAISWISLGKIFCAFMTGNLVYLGFHVGGATTPPMTNTLVALLAFALGAFVAGVIVKGAPKDVVWPRQVSAALVGTALVEVALWVLWLLYGPHPSDTQTLVMIGVLALAMGLQTIAVFATGVRSLFTTAATATIAVLMTDLSHASGSGREVVRFVGVIVALFSGACLAVELVFHARAWAPGMPLVLTPVVLVVAATRFRRQPQPS